MVRIKRGLKFRWILCFIIFSLVLLIYGNHLFKERAKKLEDMRKKEALEFMEDGWKKYRMMQYAGANMEYTDSEGNIRIIETEPVLLDVFDDINDRGQTILMVTHSTSAASRAKRVLFIKDGILYNQIFRGNKTERQMFQEISDTLTVMASEVEAHA
mgnify:CR=1 FL=1